MLSISQRPTRTTDLNFSHRLNNLQQAGTLRPFYMQRNCEIECRMIS